LGLAMGDFNKDGKPDLATANAGTNSIGVLLGNGTGGFVQAPGSPFMVGTPPVSIATADFNKDGNLDLATANHTSKNVTILLGNGTGGFAPAIGSPISVGNSPSVVVVSDFNLDNKPDLAVGDLTSLSILLGNGTGGFAHAQGSPIAMFDPYVLVP